MNKFETFNHCNWAVCYDDGNKYRTIIAWFDKPFHAEDFIKNCLPKETQHRFYILNREEI